MSEDYIKTSNTMSPLVWFIIAVIALLMVLVFFSGRSGGKQTEISLASTAKPAMVGEIKRQQEKAPGVMARELIRHTRELQRPYPLQQLYQTALDMQRQNQLADAHLLFFFTAREGYLPSILKMGEMADPVNFAVKGNLLDHPDPIQAYKWYQIASAKQLVEAQQRLIALQNWAQEQASTDKVAQQLLLNFGEEEAAQ